VLTATRFAEAGGGQHVSDAYYRHRNGAGLASREAGNERS
jgi:hypothetical protein